MEGQRALLFAYAHPDDEQGITGSIMRYLAEGTQVGLICATRGEEGEIAAGVDATPENLGTVREAEMRAAMDVVGLPFLWFLDYRDSGMDGTESNKRPDNFVNAPPEEAVGRIVEIIRTFQPQVVVTFDPTGIYFHPDHIAASRFTTAAYRAAGDANAYPDAGAPWQPSRLYYSVVPRSALLRMRDMITEASPDNSFARLPIDKMGVADEEITHQVKVYEYVDKKGESLQKHASQLSPDSPIGQMTGDQVREWRGTEYYMLVEGTPLPEGASGDDLFAGL